MSKKKKSVVPSLRFPEFQDEGEWEVKRLGEVYSFYPTNSFSRDKLSYESGTIKNIHYGDIHTKFAVLFDITKEQVPNLHPSLDIEKLDHEAYCKEGDIILADASEDIHDIGKSIEIVNLNGEKLVSGMHTIKARQKSPKLIVGFGGYLFRSAYIREQIKREAQGAKVLGISPNRLSKISVIYPSNKDEQQKIADCLYSLDEVIDFEAQKLEALRAHKKGLMQQLFPHKDKIIPGLRFPEFQDEGEWEVKRLGEVYSFYPTNSFSRDKLSYESGTIKNIHYGDIHTKFAVLFDITKEQVPNLHPSLDIEKLDYEAYCKEGDIILADASEDIDDIGKSIEIVNLNGEKLVSGLHTIKARQKSPKLIVGFGGYLFRSTYIREQIKREAQGAKVLGISPNRLSKISVIYPSNKDEQKRIADCLSSLDEMIDLEAQKLEALKTHKKGLMQQLFPQEVD